MCTGHGEQSPGGVQAPCEASAWVFVAAFMGTDKLRCAARVMLEEGVWCHAQRISKATPV